MPAMNFEEWLSDSLGPVWHATGKINSVFLQNKGFFRIKILVFGLTKIVGFLSKWVDCTFLF